MKPASANRFSLKRKPQLQEGASVRIVLIAVVSFILGVATTAFWFHSAPPRNVETPAPQANNQSDDEQSASSAANARPAARPAASSLPPVTTAAIEEVKQAVPNFATLSVEEGENILRTAALKEFAAAAKEMEARVNADQQQLLQAQNGGSAAVQQAAMEQLKQAQAAAAEKLKQVAARLQAQIAALKSLQTNK